MYIVRWLMGHPMIAVWVLGAIAILLSYGSSHKEVSNEPSHDSSMVSPAMKQVSHANIVTDAENPEQLKKPDDADNEKEVQRDSLANNKDNKASHTESMAKENENIGAGLVNETQTTLTKTEQQKTMQSVSPEISSDEIDKENGNDNSPNTGSGVEDLSSLSTEEMLVMAREAYWNNGLDEAAEIYQQLIKLEPKVVTHRGELGNVYWRQGYPKKAAELYSEIAIPMIESGNADRVANMVGFIGLFYPDRASVIQDRLEQLSNKEK